MIVKSMWSCNLTLTVVSGNNDRDRNSKPWQICPSIVEARIIMANLIAEVLHQFGYALQVVFQVLIHLSLYK